MVLKPGWIPMGAKIVAVIRWKGLVEKYITAAGFEKDADCFKEMYVKDIEENGTMKELFLKETKE